MLTAAVHLINCHNPPLSQSSIRWETVATNDTLAHWYTEVVAGMTGSDTENESTVHNT